MAFSAHIHCINYWSKCTTENEQNTITKQIHTSGWLTCWACGGTSSAPRSITAKSGAALPAFGGTCGGKTSGRTPECGTRGRGTGDDLFSDGGVSDEAGLTFWLSTSVRCTQSSVQNLYKHHSSVFSLNTSSSHKARQKSNTFNWNDCYTGRY